APRLAFLRVLLRIRSGTHIGLPQISHERSREVTVTVDRDLPAAADGDTLPWAAPLRAGTTLRIRALPGALRVLAPGCPHEDHPEGVPDPAVKPPCSGRLARADESPT